jgi:putative ABC transport system ATP-binding protein
MSPRGTHGLGLALTGVRVAYAERDGALRTVLAIDDFRLPRGEPIAVCGPSGSGKTTLLHLLAGIERPRAGSVRWGAVEISSLGEGPADRWRRETLGLVFQQFHLFPRMSALENVLLSLRFDRWSVPDAVRADAVALLARVGVRGDIDAGALSRGEQQRVALARALLRRPAILLADEPTASLDRAAATEVGDLMCELCGDVGATLIVATHDARLAERIGTVVDVERGDLRPRMPLALRPRLTTVA